MKNFKTLFCGILLLSFLSACTSLQTVKDPLSPELIFENVQLGTEVNIETLSGEKYQFVVDSITQTTISGGEEVVLIDQISSIKTEQFSFLATSGALGAYSISVTLFAMLSFALLL